MPDADKQTVVMAPHVLGGSIQGGSFGWIGKALAIIVLILMAYSIIRQKYAGYATRENQIVYAGGDWVKFPTKGQWIEPMFVKPDTFDVAPQMMVRFEYPNGATTREVRLLDMQGNIRRADSNGNDATFLSMKMVPGTYTQVEIRPKYTTGL